MRIIKSDRSEIEMGFVTELFAALDKNDMEAADAVLKKAADAAKKTRPAAKLKSVSTKI
jgi:hypothetical protein